MVVTMGQQYNIGEKPTVIMYTYINRHVEPPNITSQKSLYNIFKRVVITYDNRAIEPYVLCQLEKEGVGPLLLVYMYVLSTPSRASSVSVHDAVHRTTEVQHAITTSYH